MSLRHLLGPETNSSFFTIDAYTTNALKFTLILKKKIRTAALYIVIKKILLRLRGESLQKHFIR